MFSSDMVYFITLHHITQHSTVRKFSWEALHQSSTPTPINMQITLSILLTLGAGMVSARSGGFAGSCNSNWVIVDDSGHGPAISATCNNAGGGTYQALMPIGHCIGNSNGNLVYMVG